MEEFFILGVQLSYLLTKYFYIMKEESKQFLNIADLLEALDKGCFKEELQKQLSARTENGELMRDICADMITQENEKPKHKSPSVQDIIRYEFHENGSLHIEDYRLSEEQRRKYIYPIRGKDTYAED